MQIFLASAVTLLDDGIFRTAPDKMQGLFEAMLSLLEKMLGMEKGSLGLKAQEYWKFE